MNCVGLLLAGLIFLDHPGPAVDTVQRLGPETSLRPVTTDEDAWTFNAGTTGGNGEEKSWLEINVPKEPKAADKLYEVRNGGVPVVSIAWDGNVKYDTNKADQATRAFWDAFTANFTNVQKRLALDYLKKIIEREESR